jgi:hypothetical protein
MISEKISLFSWLLTAMSNKADLSFHGEGEFDTPKTPGG